MMLLPLAPAIALSLAAIVLLLAARRLRGRPALPAAVTLLAAAAAAGLAGWLPAPSAGGVFSALISFDGYARFFTVIFALNLAACALLSMRLVSEDRVPAAEYYTLLLLATAGMTLAASATELLTLYLGIELMALCSYILVGLRRDRLDANEAAMKYFVLGSFASALLLYGASLVYGLTGTTELAGVAAAAAARGLSRSPMMIAAMILLGSAFAFKVSAVPFHAWAPDAYEGASTPVAAFLAVGSKAAGFAALGRVFIVAFAPHQASWSVLLAALAALSMIVGTLMALSQTNVKRLLAYSAVAHAGYALLGVLPGTGPDLAATASYLLAYSFMTLGAFGVVVRLGERGERIEGYEGLAAQRPWTAGLMLLFLLSLTGIPPTAGFAAKFLVFTSALRAGYLGLALIGVACSVVSAFFYLRLVVLMYMKPARDEAPARCPAPVGIALALAAAAVLIGGLFPQLMTAPAPTEAAAVVKAQPPSSPLQRRGRFL